MTNIDMKIPFRVMKISLCALGLGACVAAHAAAPDITGIAMIPQLTITSDVGVTNQIQYTNDLSGSAWAILTNVVVTQSPYTFIDASAAGQPTRFYQVLMFTNTVVSNPPPSSGMALIPAGNYVRGAVLDGDPDAPTNTVNVGAFYIDTNLVTFALWKQVTGYAANHGYSFDHPGLGKAANNPVETVDWYDAVIWCNARSEMEGRTPCYYTDSTLTAVYLSGDITLATNCVNWAANGYRLPTEAEWEKAARGGVAGQRFPWGNTIAETRADYFANTLSFPYDQGPTGYNSVGVAGGTPYTTPVGTFAANGYGLRDMSGNVAEWCWDWYASTYYSSPSSLSDPHGPATSSVTPAARVLRGGSWSALPSYERCSDRGHSTPSYENTAIGFRCVRAGTL